MAIAESILPEFDHETATTRTLLERVPEAQAGWKPHARSMSLGELAMHIANIPVVDIHYARAQGVRYESARRRDDEAGVRVVFTAPARLRRERQASRALLARTSDGEFMVQWTLKNGGKSQFSMPRVAVFRSFVLNHAVHHRGQLSVYLRLLDVPLPNIYGPTADT